MKVSIVRESSMYALLNHRGISPDYKLCTDIFKMCIF